MNRFVLVFIGFCILFVKQLDAQEHRIVVLNQNINLHATSNMLSLHNAEYLLQVKESAVAQKLLFSPLKFGKKERAKGLRDLRVNLAQEGGLTTVGIGHGFSWEFDQERGANAFTQLIAGVNWTLFPNWGSPSRDDDGDGLVDNFYPVANKNFTIGVARINGNVTHYFANVVYEQKREREIENSKEVTAIGYSVGVMKYINSLNNDLLAHQVKLGAVIEQSLPIHNQGALSNGNSYVLSIAPQLEAQFFNKLALRVSLPFVVTEGKKDERGFGSFFQLFMVI